MKSILLAVALAALTTVPAHAVLVGLLLPFKAGASEVLVGIVNRCATPMTYNVVIQKGTTGAVLARSRGTLDPDHGTALPYSFGATQTGSFVRAIVKWECPDPVVTRPLISVALRDKETKVPLFMVDPYIGETEK
jgi:hypothetical protein